MTETSEAAMWLWLFPDYASLKELEEAYPEADLVKAQTIVNDYKDLRRGNHLD